MNKWYLPNPAFVQDNETHKIFWNFEIQTDHPISTRRPDLVPSNKKYRTFRIVDSAVQTDHRVKLNEKKKKKKNGKYLDLSRKLKKLWIRKVKMAINCNWCFWYSHQSIDTGTGRLTTSGVHPKYHSIIKIGQDSRESHGKLRTLGITQAQVRNPRLTLVWRIQKVVKW